jgi:hypothetical protein
VLSINVKIKIYKTIILPVVLYGCETWSLTLREEHRLRVFENRVLRRIFGPTIYNITTGNYKLLIYLLTNAPEKLVFFQMSAVGITTLII